MAKFVFLILVTVCVCLFVCIASGLPTSEDERYYDKDLNRELFNWLASVHYTQAMNNLCRYYPGNTLSAPMPKRNSELINSLLSLPKNMNDAGK